MGKKVLNRTIWKSIGGSMPRFEPDETFRLVRETDVARARQHRNKERQQGRMDPHKMERQEGFVQAAHAGGLGCPAHTGVLPDQHEQRECGVAAKLLTGC